MLVIKLKLLLGNCHQNTYKKITERGSFLSLDFSLISSFSFDPIFLGSNNMGQKRTNHWMANYNQGILVYIKSFKEQSEEIQEETAAIHNLQEHMPHWPNSTC